jgi:predicted kinase
MKVIKKRILSNYTNPVYDLKIKDNHNYFITTSNILVHNSGKSYVLSKIKSGSIEPRIVNIDKITEYLDIEHIEKVYDKAKQLSKNQLVQYLNGVLPLFIDTTAANPQRLKIRVNTLERIGYDCAMIFVNTSLETSLKRASQRQRVVPPQVIEDYYKKIQKLKDDMKGLFSFHMEINNNEGELTDDVILKAYKRISYFYDADIDNPIGNERYSQMLDNKWSYLSPNIMSLDEIKNITNQWYS